MDKLRFWHFGKYKVNYLLSTSQNPKNVVTTIYSDYEFITSQNKLTDKSVPEKCKC